MIDHWLRKVDQAKPQLIFWWIVGCSILLAAWMQYIQHGWINPDSVLYFEQAKRFALGEWSAGFNIFKWPLYGLCISLTHQLTSLPIQASSQLLNMLFFGMATASFLRLIQLAGGNNRTWIMGALLLFSSQYIVGDILEMLMRDEGFWAFYLTALVFFIRFTQQQKLKDATLWQLCIIVATLFRIEAILFLIFLPLIYLSTQASSSIKHNLKQLIKTYSVSLFLGMLIALAIITQPQLSMSSFGRLSEIFSTTIYQQFTQKLFLQAGIMSSQVLGSYLEEFAIPGLLLTFAYVISSKILTSTGLIGTALAFYYFKKTPQNIHTGVKNVLLITGCIALLTAALIITKVFVLSSRYVIAFAWILLIFASFYLTTLSFRSHKKLRMVFLVLCIMLGLGLIKNILPKRAGYNYSQDAVAWVKAINKGNEPVFYNQAKMRYYANQEFIGSWANNRQVLATAIDSQSIDQYSYLLIYSSQKNVHEVRLITDKIPQFKLIKTFKNYKQKKLVLIFKKN